MVVPKNPSVPGEWYNVAVLRPSKNHAILLLLVPSLLHLRPSISTIASGLMIRLQRHRGLGILASGLLAIGAQSCPSFTSGLHGSDVALAIAAQHFCPSNVPAERVLRRQSAILPFRVRKTRLPDVTYNKTVRPDTSRELFFSSRLTVYNVRFHWVVLGFAPLRTGFWTAGVGSDIVPGKPW